MPWFIVNSKECVDTQQCALTGNCDAHFEPHAERPCDRGGC